MTKVDVIITCYNKEATIARAIKSVKQQTLKDFFCIVVDDGSTDNSWKVINNEIKNDKRFIAVQLKNCGVANARNVGISYGTSPYISCLDGDDGIEATFLEVCHNAISQDRGLGLVYTEGLLHHPDSNFSVANWTKVNHNAQFEGRNQIPCCNMFRRDIFERVGGYRQRYSPKGAGAEDAELWLRFFKLGYKAKKVTEEPLFIYNFFGGITQNSKYSEVNWINWHTTEPFPSLQNPENGIAHIVNEYDDPKISVIIPVIEKHLHYLQDALDSLEAQIFTNWEAIVVFDFPSIIETSKEIEYYEKAYPYVKFLYTSGGLGAGIARNCGVGYAKGQYIVFLDADDYLQPRFLGLCLSALEHFDADWIYTDLYSQTIHSREQYNKEAQALCANNIYHSVIREGADWVEFIQDYKNHEWSIEKLYHSGIAAVTALYKKSDFELVGGFDTENNREDWDFHMRLAKAGKCGLRLPVPLLTYRLNTGIRREYIGTAKNIEESKALKQKDVERIHTTYNLEELKMACSTCKQKKIDIQNQTKSADELYTLEYTGKIAGGVVNGPVSRKPYPLNTFNGKTVIYKVLPQDAQALITRGVFIPLQKESKQPAASIIVSPTPAKPEIIKLSHSDRLKASMEVAEKARREAKAQMEAELAAWDRASTEALETTEEEISTALTWYDNPDSFTLVKIKEVFNKYDIEPERVQECYDNEAMGKARKGVLNFLKGKL
jgi:glycosyltransferase involved in cell wall biosynthesis